MQRRLTKSIQVAGLALVSALTAFVGAQLMDGMAAQKAFVHLCAARAGTYSVDKITGTVSRRETLACSLKSEGHVCREVALPGDRLNQQGIVPLGFLLDRQRGEGPITIDYTVYRGSGQYYVTVLDFKGPQPGLLALLNDKFGFFPASNISCFDL